MHATKLIEAHPWLLLVGLAIWAIAPYVVIDMLNRISIAANMGWQIPFTWETWFACAVLIAVLR